MKPFRILLIVAAIAATELALAIWFLDLPHTDFGSFYRSGLAVWHHGDPYTDPVRLNLNPPIVTATLFALLALLPLGIAAKVWLGLSVLSLGASLHVLKRELGLTLEHTVTIAAILLVTVPARHVWEEGQIVWLLLYPLTQAWASYRQGRSVAAGMWLAPVIACKPFLALLVLPLAVPVWFVAGAGSAALTAIGIGLVGVPTFRSWLALSGTISWLNDPANASVWAVLARLIAPAPGTVVGMAGIGSMRWIVLVAAVAFVALSFKVQSPDRRFGAGLLTAILLSPLGWVYYLPLTLAPLMAVWRPRGLSIAALVALTVPMPIVALLGQTSGLAYVGIGSLYTWATLALFVSVIWEPRHDMETNRMGVAVRGVPRRSGAGVVLGHRILRAFARPVLNSRTAADQSLRSGDSRGRSQPFRPSLRVQPNPPPLVKRSWAARFARSSCKTHPPDRRTSWLGNRA